MKEKVILIIVVILMFVLIGGAVMVMNFKGVCDYAKEKLEDEQYKANLEYSGENIIETSGEQIENIAINYVTDENFEAEVLKSVQTVVVDFYADWCGPCKTLAPILQEYVNENPNIKVVKLNVDDNQKTAMNYSVSSIPTLVVIKDGVETNRLVGVNSKENIKKAVEFVKK